MCLTLIKANIMNCEINSNKIWLSVEETKFYITKLLLEEITAVAVKFLLYKNMYFKN